MEYGLWRHWYAGPHAKILLLVLGVIIQVLAPSNHLWGYITYINIFNIIGTRWMVEL